MGATFVYLQASSRVLGKPRSAKRAMAAVAQHGQPGHVARHAPESEPVEARPEHVERIPVASGDGDAHLLTLTLAGAGSFSSHA